jgi:hypothetical protein
MPGRIRLVEIEITHGVVLPTLGVMQGVGSSIAPVAVEVVLLQGGFSAAQLKQLVAD